MSFLTKKRRLRPLHTQKNILFKKKNACGPITHQKNFLLKGKVFQEKPITKYDKGFGINVAYYENKTSFYQKIKPLANSFEISGVIKYMVCDESQCLALEKVFSVKVNRQD